MHYVYVLRDKSNKKLYIGYSSDIEQRLKRHQLTNKDIELIYYEAYQLEEIARDRERRLKMYGSSWRALKQRLKLPPNKTA